jgi:hypothetical protein
MVSVVAVNVTRMSLMGLSQAHYRLLHSPWGDMITNVVTLCVIMTIYLVGVRRELVGRA